MSEQFIVEQLEILNDENDFKGEYWWAVINTQRVEDSFECRSKEVALKLCDFLNKATDDFKWQIRRCEKWSAIVKQLKKENEQLLRCKYFVKAVEVFTDCPISETIADYSDGELFDEEEQLEFGKKMLEQEKELVEDE